MKVIGWATDVNQKIIDETTWTIGEGGTVKDSTSNGYEETRATSLATPDKYKVVMYFDWGGAGSEFQTGVDAAGRTEYERFIRWYKYICKKGANPFWFPAITQSPIDNLKTTDKNGMCLYKIDSPLSISKSGYSMKVTMDWKEVYSGTVTVPQQVLEVIGITADTVKDYAEITMMCNALPESLPAVSSVGIFIKSINAANYGAASPIIKYKQHGRDILFYVEKPAVGIYKVMLQTMSSSVPAVTVETVLNVGE